MKIGYARVSSREQAEDSDSLNRQIAALKKAGAEEVLFDVQTGKDDDRTSYQRLLEMVKQGAISQVLVTKQDRLSRNNDTLSTLPAIFKSSGVRLTAVEETIDITNAQGRFLYNIGGAVAQHELDRLTERIRLGVDHYINSKLARRPPFGYTTRNDKFILDTSFCDHVPEHLGKMTTENVARDWIAIFFAKRTLRKTIQAINNKYEITRVTQYDTKGRVKRHEFGFSPGGFSKWLHHPTLLGHTAYRRRNGNKMQKEEEWDIQYNTHPDQALLNADQLAEIDEILEGNKQTLKFTTNKAFSPLTGIIKCAVCGAGMHHKFRWSRDKSHKYHYYRCNRVDESCSNKKMAKLQTIEDAIFAKIGDIQMGCWVEKIKQEKVRDSRIDDLERQIQGLDELLAISSNPAIETAKEQLRNQIKAITESSQFKDQSALTHEETITIANALWRSHDPDQVCDHTKYPDGSMFDFEALTSIRKLIREVHIKDGEVEAIILHSD